MAANRHSKDNPRAPAQLAAALEPRLVESLGARFLIGQNESASQPNQKMNLESKQKSLNSAAPAKQSTPRSLAKAHLTAGTKNSRSTT